MMYKFIDENTIKRADKRYIKHNGRIYVNPTKQMLEAAGYKELIETEYPEYNPDTEYVTDKYVDGSVITHVYEVKEFNI